jgi:protein-disulfide isomerase/uncharacterized membrane protein
MTSAQRNLLLGFAVLGLGASLTSSYVHYRLLTDVSFTSFCDVSSAVNCTQAYMSSYGSAFGVPVALGGVMYFAIVAVLAGIVGRPGSKSRENAPGYILALSTLALAFILYLAWGSYVVLKTFCILCAVTYVAVIAIFLISGGATKFPMKTLPDRARRDARTLVTSPLALLIAVLFVAGGAIAVAAFPRDGAQGSPTASAQAPAALPAVTDDERAKIAQWWEVQPKIELPVPAGDAKVLIVKFNDYQCPACGQSYLVYKPVLEKYAKSNPGEVRVVLKDYPLNSECNANVNTVMHGAACDAAVAVRLARQHNRAEALEEWLYTNQASMTPESVRKAAREIGQVTDFDAKYASTLESVKSDIAYGKQLAVRSTPTFFINGVKVEGAMQPQFFDQAIAYELQHPRGQ